MGVFIMGSQGIGLACSSKEAQEALSSADRSEVWQNLAQPMPKLSGSGKRQLRWIMLRELVSETEYCAGEPI